MYSDVTIEYDTVKDRINMLKHGVSLAEAEGVLHDEWAITINDADASGESRRVTLGADTIGRILIVIHTQRQDRTRVISARKASPNESRFYDEKRIRLQQR
jgi:uncharacterized DUF497 family protein